MKHLLLLPILLGAAALPRLISGEYAVTSTPGQATLDGRPLGDLPYTAKAPERTCLSPAQAQNPGALIRTQVPAGCTVASATNIRQGVTLTGTCPPQAAGLARGSFRLTGRWTADSYQVRFATENPSENGRMGFTGQVDARRLGPCPG